MNPALQPESLARRSANVRVIGAGQPSAGDDGVAARVIDRLRELLTTSELESVDVRFTTDPTQLLNWLRGPQEIWLIDALVGAGEAGQVLFLAPDEFDTLASSTVSSHGVSLMQAIELCRTLYPQETSTNVHFAAITIDPPSRYSQTLSPNVAHAAEQCAELLAGLLRTEVRIP